MRKSANKCNTVAQCQLSGKGQQKDTSRVMFLRKPLFWMPAAAILTMGTVATPSIYRTAVLGSGFMTQFLCSSDPQVVLTEDMSGPGYELLWFFRPRVERDAKRVTASMYGLGRRTAIFREGLGCTLVVDRTEDELRAQAVGVFSPPPPPNPDALWPEGEGVDLEILPQGVDHIALEAGVEAAFAEPDSARLRRTRALVVGAWGTHRGRALCARIQCHHAPHRVVDG
jgi:hypothetical protein